MKTIEAAAVRYACRRGMLELDLMLQRFFDRHFDTLSEAQKQSFAAFLEESDPQLWDWLRGDVRPEQPDFLSLVQMIRA